MANITTHNHGETVTFRIEDEGGLTFFTVRRKSLPELAEKVTEADLGIFDEDLEA